MSKRPTRSNTSNTSASASDSSSNPSNSTDTLPPPSSNSLVAPSTPTAPLASNVFGGTQKGSISNNISTSKRGSVVSAAGSTSTGGKTRLVTARPGQLHCPSPIKDNNETGQRARRAMEERRRLAAEEAQKTSNLLAKAKNGPALSKIAESEDLDRTPRATLDTRSTLSSLTSAHTSFDSPIKSSRSASSSSSVSSFDSMTSTFSKSSLANKEKRFKNIEIEEEINVLESLYKEGFGGDAIAKFSISVAVSEASVLGWESCPVPGCSYNFPTSSSKPVVRRVEHLAKYHPRISLKIQEST